MARYYVEKDGEWNVFSTIVDDFIFDDFVCLEALKAYLIYERYKELTEDIDSLLTDRPRVNVMAYEEAVKRIRKDEPQINADQHTQRVEYVESDERSRCWKCKHFERMHETPISSDGSYYTYVVCTAKECNYELQTEREDE